MKNLLKLLPILALVFSACSVEPIDTNLENNLNVTTETNLILPEVNDPCSGDDPITRVINNGTISFDLQVIDQDGNVLVDIPSIPSNSTTSWASFASGEVLFSVSNNAPMVNDDKVLLVMDTCMAYEIEIDSNNEIVSYLPTTL